MHSEYLNQISVLNIRSILLNLSGKNKVIISAAGSGKTTNLVREALNRTDQRILITTYTRENHRSILSKLVCEKGYIPPNIEAHTWFTFLLRDCVRPYQNAMGNIGRVCSINFEPKHSRYNRKTSLSYYIDKGKNIYRDAVSEFAFECNKKVDGLVIKRLEQIYDSIFIDEVQDISGFDLDLIELLLNSSIELIMVGDPRQATYNTTQSQRRYHQFRGSNIIKWFENLKRIGKLKIERQCGSYRCNKKICAFADALYPDLPPTRALSDEETGHDGVFIINKSKAPDYIKTFHPVILRHDKRNKTLGYPALNYGESKGREFERVLIFPTVPIEKYLKTRDLDKLKDQSRAKLYVAVTRAKHSVAFIIG